MTGLSLNEAVEWRTPIWVLAVSSALDRAAAMLPSNAKVLEIGYNSGMMSCYMAARYGWNIVGYDIYDSAKDRAEETSRRYGLEGMTGFHVCSPDETLFIKGDYDAIFLKSVLYHISDKAVYRSWLDWLHSVVKDGGWLLRSKMERGGCLINFIEKSLSDPAGPIFCFSIDGQSRNSNKDSDMWMSSVLVGSVSSLSLCRKYAG